MQTRITMEEMEAAAQQLAKTERGCIAMKHLAELLDGGVLDLDLLDQRALLALLGGAWSGQTEKAREIIRATLTKAGRRD